MTDNERREAEKKRLVREITRELEGTGEDLTRRLAAISERLAAMKALYDDGNEPVGDIGERAATLLVAVPIRLLMTAATLLMCTSTPKTAEKLSAALDHDSRNLHEYARGICDVITSILREREHMAIVRNTSIH